MIKNVLSIDLESFAHRQFNIDERINKDDGYTVKTTSYILDLLEKYNTRATFFVVGEIYEWYPDLIEEIKERGHEIGYHTHRHIIIKNKDILIEELRRSKKFLNKYKPKGFRAPRMYIKKEYFNILSAYGFSYDSSVYGTYSQRGKYNEIEEIPVSFFPYFSSNAKLIFPQNISLKILTKGIPYGSGLQISIFQKHLQRFIDNSNSKNEPAIIFFHPWQIMTYKDDNIKKTIFNIPRFIYRRKINNTLEYLLANNSFGPFIDLLRNKRNL